MNWRDLLYFSKGERRALSVLLGLIAVSWILLLVSALKKETTGQEKQIVRTVNTAIPHKETTAPVADTIRTKNHTTAIHTTKNKQAPPSGGRNFPKLPVIPNRKYTRSEKFPPGTVVELNTADTATLKKVPGIGSTFARRIIKYRDLLGGFYTVSQLKEVYGIDEERYLALEPWFTTDTTYIRKLPVNLLPADSLRRHPYIDYKQAYKIGQLRKQKRRLTGWENLQLLEEFTDTDLKRLKFYLSF
jgi:hypothetical protein